MIILDCIVKAVFSSRIFSVLKMYSFFSRKALYCDLIFFLSVALSFVKKHFKSNLKSDYSHLKDRVLIVTRELNLPCDNPM